MTPTFLALGDSYTIGEGVEVKDRWPAQLVARLRVSGIAIDGLRIIARTGWTTGELADAIAAERVTGRFDLVTLLAGVNDQYRGFGVERFRTTFDSLVLTARQFTKLPTGLLVLSIPDWGVTPFAAGRDQPAIGREIDIFNGVARDAAIRHGARFIDITPASRLAATDRSLLASDGLHPSRVMYQQWVDQLIPFVTDALAASS